MTWVKNTTGIMQGSYRSLNGAADESIFQGKASKAGFYCFFKVWRDMPYDAVLDHDGILFRVEVKGSSGSSFDFSRGGRAGVQIDRAAGSRKRLINRGDCDFVAGINSDNGDCYIIPTDIIEIIGQMVVSKNALSDYIEKWNLFKFSSTRLSPEETRDGLMNKTVTELDGIALKLKMPSFPTSIKTNGVRNKSITDAKQIRIWEIWKYLTK